MGISTIKDEYINKLAYLPKMVIGIMARFTTDYKLHSIRDCDAEIEKAIKVLDEMKSVLYALKRTVIFVKNTESAPTQPPIHKL